MTPEDEPQVLHSTVYFAAAIAAEKALPEHSRALIQRHDQLHREWRNNGWPSPIPDALAAAGDAVRADTLANFAMELRRRGNDASLEEYRRLVRQDPDPDQMPEAPR